MFQRLNKMFTLLVIVTPLAMAGGHNFGLGFVLGEPTALDAKLWTSETTALDFGLGWGLGYNGYDDKCWNNKFYYNNQGYCNDRGYDYNYRDDQYGYRGLHLHADYLFHNFNVIHSSEKFPIYYGPGINLNFWNHGGAQIGFRGVGGIAWMPRATPIDLFFEIAPIIQIFPGTGFDLNAGIGARFYF